MKESTNFFDLESEDYSKHLDRYLEFHQLEIDRVYFGISPGTIISAAGFIMSLLEEDNTETWLKKISSQLTKIQETLFEVVDLLKKLKIQISKEFEDFVTKDMIATIQLIHINNPIWEQDITNPVNQKHIQENRDLIIKSARKAMTYGFGHYDTIMLALKIELYLMNISSGYPKASIKNAVKHYDEYIRKALDNKIEGSIENKIMHFTNQIHALEKTFIPRTLYFGCVTENYSRGRRQCERKFQLSSVYKGSIEKGFSVQRKKDKISDWCEIDDIGRGGSDWLIEDLSSLHFGSSCRKNFPSSKQNYWDKHYKNAHSEYVDATKKLFVLTNSKIQLIKYKKFITNLLSEL